jgi:hypothetical protein
MLEDKEAMVTNHDARLLKVANIYAIICRNCIDGKPDCLGFFELLNGARYVKRATAKESPKKRLVSGRGRDNKDPVQKSGLIIQAIQNVLG